VYFYVLNSVCVCVLTGVKSDSVCQTLRTCFISEAQWLTGLDLTTTPASCKMGTESSPEVKRPGRGADHPPPPSAEVENE
jgi:hypothetical protein